MVSCVGQPPFAGTIQRLLRPLMLEMNATCLPSGDQVELPIEARHVELLDGECRHVGHVLAFQLGGVGDGLRNSERLLRGCGQSHKNDEGCEDEFQALNFQSERWENHESHCRLRCVFRARRLSDNPSARQRMRLCLRESALPIRRRVGSRRLQGVGHAHWHVFTEVIACRHSCNGSFAGCAGIVPGDLVR